MTQHKFQLREEFKIIPGFAIALAITVFFGLQALLHYVMTLGRDVPPIGFRIFISLLAGTVLGIVILLYGYVYRDAKRRGMNPVGWLLVVIFIPNAIGFIIYFLMRSEIVSKCPQCGAAVKDGYNFCPKCHFALSPVCPHCRRPVTSSDIYCPYCGNEIAMRA